jgi:DNA-binding transcriptional MocR family regulator
MVDALRDLAVHATRDNRRQPTERRARVSNGMEERFTHDRPRKQTQIPRIMTCTANSGAAAEASAFAYERLAADIGMLIESGTIRPDERLPSVRRMSARRRVSIPTVLQAYQLLEARHVIAARPRSGFYVLPRQAGPTAAARDAASVPDPTEITSGDLIVRLLDMVANPTLMPLGTALPDPDLLPCASLGRMMGRVVRRNATRSATLFTPAGEPELRRRIARRTVDAGSIATPDDVVVTSGCTEAIWLCLRALTRSGATVAVESPSYFGTLQAISALGLRALEIPTDPATGMSLDALAIALDRGGISAVVVTPNVHNPLGSVMPDDAKAGLMALARRHDVPVIEDETYAELYHGASRPGSLRAFDTTGLVLSCGSFSKTLAPGYRVGWTIPGRFRDRVLHYKLATTASVAVPTQLAIAELLGSGSFDPHLQKLRRVFRSNVHRWTSEVLERFPEGTRVSRPMGGFLLWVQLSEGVDTVKLQRSAVKRGLGIAPGPAFSATGRYSNCLRMNAGYAWSERTARAVEMAAELITRAR